MSSISLRTFSIEDADQVAILVGDQAVSEWTANIPFPYTRQDAVDWIMARKKEKDRRPFAVEVDGELVACVSFHPHGESEVEVGYWVGKEHWGKGIGTEALRLLLAHQDFPKDKRVIAKVMKGNVASEKVLENCGFRYSENCTLEKAGEQYEGIVYALSKPQQR